VEAVEMDQVEMAIAEGAVVVEDTKLVEAAQQL
jgi:hypothetical protein